LERREAQGGDWRLELKIIWEKNRKCQENGVKLMRTKTASQVNGARAQVNGALLSH